MVLKSESDISIKSEDIKSKNMKDYKCSPAKRFQDGSCIPLPALIEMAIAYNKTNDKKIILNNKLETLNPKKYKMYLIKQFNRNLERICDNQRCWLKQDFVKLIDKKIKEDLEKNTFRPPGPQGTFTWLNTFDINQVMEQYEYKYPEFKFLGAVPADFEEISYYGIKDLDFDTLINKNKTKIGVILNLDEHDKPGSHWVGLYADIKNGIVYFSDSYGENPKEPFRKFMRKISRYAKNKFNIPEKDLIVDHNKKRHQFGNSECGMFSLNFIIRLLNGEDFDTLFDKPINDKKVNACRKVYFT